jgi:hypothetical protein
MIKEEFDQTLEGYEMMEKLFDTINGDPIRESVASKLLRHGYASVGNDILNSILTWLDECGIKYSLQENGRLQTYVHIGL